MRSLDFKAPRFAALPGTTEVIPSRRPLPLQSVLAPAVPYPSPFEGQPPADLVFAPPGPGKGFTMIFAGTTPFPTDEHGETPLDVLVADTPSKNLDLQDLFVRVSP